VPGGAYAGGGCSVLALLLLIKHLVIVLLRAAVFRMTMNGV
jgi:hypothetical protein